MKSTHTSVPNGTVPIACRNTGKAGGAFTKKGFTVTVLAGEVELKQAAFCGLVSQSVPFGLLGVEIDPLTKAIGASVMLQDCPT